MLSMREIVAMSHSERNGERVSASIIGLRIKCQTLGRIVNVPREDFAIGPRSKPTMAYVVRCRCGGLHRIPAQKVTKPTKSKQAIPIARNPAGESK